MNPRSSSTLVRDAEWLAHRYDAAADAVHFRHVPRSRRSEIPFLTDEYLGGDAERAREQEDAAKAHGEEIARVTQWPGAVAATAGVSMTLPQPLLAWPTWKLRLQTEKGRPSLAAPSLVGSC